MTVRCPACKTLHKDPQTLFRCTGCRRLLNWSWHAARAVQLSLLDDMGAVPVRSVEAPLPGGARRSPTEVPAPVPFGSTKKGRLLTDSIACVTAHLSAAGPPGALLSSLLQDRTPEDLLALLATTSWLASVLLRQLDEAVSGAGTAWLQGLALGLAEST